MLLLDVSGSMEPYARALLRFVHAAVAGRQKVEAFTLGTRLTRITRELASRDPDRALDAAGRRVADWTVDAFLAHPRAGRVVLAVALGITALSLASRGHPVVLPLDDAYIPLEYARTAAAGEPFRYFPREPVSTGATSPLWLEVIRDAARHRPRPRTRRRRRQPRHRQGDRSVGRCGSAIAALARSDPRSSHGCELRTLPSERFVQLHVHVEMPAVGRGGIEAGAHVLA